jgi:hypothetical protein
MSRTQFVRNTVQAIQSQVQSGPNLARASTPDLTNDDASSAHATRSDGSETGGSTLRSRSKRSSSVHSWTSVSRDALSFIGTPATGQVVTPPTGTPSQNASTASVQTPTSGQNSVSAEPRVRTGGSQSSSSGTSMVYGRNWDAEMENMLRVSGGGVLLVMKLTRCIFRTCTLPSRVKRSGNQQGSSRHLTKCPPWLPIPLSIPLCGIEANAGRTAWRY